MTEQLEETTRFTVPAAAVAAELPIAGPPFKRPPHSIIKVLAGVSSATASALMHRMGVRQTFIAGALSQAMANEPDLEWGQGRFTPTFPKLMKLVPAAYPPRAAKKTRARR